MKVRDLQGAKRDKSTHEKGWVNAGEACNGKPPQIRCSFDGPQDNEAADAEK
jgi:hypothetical protein